MKIIRLDVKETESGWHLKDARFDDINLLVGVSGVGKTKIVEALRTLAEMAFKSNVELVPMKWSLEFVHNEGRYLWEGELARKDDSAAIFSDESLHFICENLTLNGNKLIARTKEQMEFNGQHSPKLDPSKSALSLLAGEKEVATARSAFMFIAFESGNVISGEGYRFPNIRRKDELLGSVIHPGREVFEKLPKTHKNQVAGIFQFIMTWAASLTSEKNPEALIAYITKQLEPARFHRIANEFCAIFPSVHAVTVDFTDKLRLNGDPLVLQFAIKETGCSHWILQPHMSSGMLRTLLHMVAVDAAIPGTVFVVDEFENSLGKNCLPYMTETLLEHLGEIQFILTSHHPYVIHKIPVDCWQLVRRQGSTVTLTSARDIPALMDESHHDAFDRLLNIDEFIDGIGPSNEENT